MASPYPLYNTTYTLHRLSPLHAFPSLTNPSTFTPHAKSLLSILRGNVLRGVRVANDDDESLGRAGRLKNVTWRVLVGPTQWRQLQDEEAAEPTHDPRGVMIEFIYEKATYTSILLLPTASPSRTAKEFTSLPLLLTRLPKSLRETLLNYLETTFDTTALPLPLDSIVLQRLLERWLDTVLSGGDETGKDIQIVFSAPSPGSSLKAITMTISRDDVSGFYQRGQKLLGDSEDGGAFFEALRHYAEGTMGLDIGALKVMKIACGGFVLGVGTGEGPGKVKVFAPRVDGEEEQAAEGVVVGLVQASLVDALR